MRRIHPASSSLARAGRVEHLDTGSNAGNAQGGARCHHNTLKNIPVNCPASVNLPIPATGSNPGFRAAATDQEALMKRQQLAGRRSHKDSQDRCLARKQQGSCQTVCPGGAGPASTARIMKSGISRPFPARTRCTG